MDLASFRRQWETTGPADIRLTRVAATQTNATYSLDLQFPKTNDRQKIEYKFERVTSGPGQGHARFEFWLFVNVKIIG